MSNAHVYLTIAEEALAESKQLDQAARTPRPDGEPGFVIAYDQERTSFKRSLVAMVFSGVYLEAILYIVGVERLGKDEYIKIDRKHYEEKLRALGITDPEILATCKRFRDARNDLVHEKALEPHEIETGRFHMAQREADVGVSFVKVVARLLQSTSNFSSSGRA